MHRPILAAAANAVDEIGEDFPSERCVGDFRMKLQTKKLSRTILDGGEIRILRHGHRLKAGRHLRQFVPMRIPNLKSFRQIGEQWAEAIFDAECSLAVFAFLAGFDFAAEKMGHDLQTVTKTKNRHSQFKDSTVRQGRLIGKHARRAA